MAKQRKRKIERREIYFIRADGIEIGPFRSEEAARAEGRQIKKEGAESVKLSRQSVSVDADLYPSSEPEEPEEGNDDDELDDDDEIEWERFTSGDDDEDDEIEDDDDDEDEEDDEDDEEDDPPLITHTFFRPIGGKK